MLDLDPRALEAVIDLCEGNPGALTVLMSTYKEVGSIDFFRSLEPWGKGKLEDPQSGAASKTIMVKTSKSSSGPTPSPKDKLS